MNNLKRLLYAALFASLITITTAYIVHIPLPGGGYIHPGDALIYLCACLLPAPWAMGAAALGGSLADLLTAPIYAPWTFVLKLLLVPAFSRRSDKLLCRRNGLALVTGGLVTIVGYYFADWALLGVRPSLIAYLPGNGLQAVGSAVLFLALAAAFDRTGLKQRVFGDI